MKSVKIGRPRAFDENWVLEQAMLVFWRHGYESSSMSLLAEHMGMNAPSIYAAFGDKKVLFLKALDLYVGDLEELKNYLAKSPSAFDAARGTLIASAIRFTGVKTPPGCMLASATASGSAESRDVQIVAGRKRAAIETLLRERIEHDIELKILSKKTSAGALATLTIAIIQGMSVLARDGGSRKKLLALVDSAMGSWPAPSSR